MEIIWQYSAVSFEMLQTGSCLRLNLEKVWDDHASSIFHITDFQEIVQIYKIAWRNACSS